MNRRFVLIVILGLLVGHICAQNITTVAGGGPTLGDGGLAINASLGVFSGIAVDDSCNIYIADGANKRLRKVSMPDGIISTIAGTGVAGYSGDGGPATMAQLSGPSWVTIDHNHNIYITDGINQRIRKINGITGVITTVAGNGTSGYSGDGGSATSAQLNGPQGIAFDFKGNLYIADGGNQRLRRVDTFGTITTVAGNGNIGYSGDGGPAILAEMTGVYGICTDKMGNVYIADQNANRIRKMDTFGIISTVAGDGVAAFGGDGGSATSAHLDFPFGVTVDSIGCIYIADQVNNRIRKVDELGIIHTIAGTGVTGFGGDGGLADSAILNRPSGVALDKCGNLFIADKQNGRARKITYDSVCCYSNPVDTTDTTTFIHNTKITGSINIYPNPAKEQITITGGCDVQDVMIVNTIGQVLITQKSYRNKAAIDVSALGTGIYFIKVIDRSGVEVVKRFLKE